MKGRVFFSRDVLGSRAPDGVFDRAPSELLEHQTPHTECPERIANIVSMLKRGPLRDHLEWDRGEPATDDEILAFHGRDYLDRLVAADAQGRWFTPSTHLPAGGLKAVRAAAGTTLAAARVAIATPRGPTYALVRPPGHHAAPDTADGYCLVNNVALAVLEALAHGIGRVAVLDWDVHHGNGTQEGFYDRADVLTISIHMDHGAWGPNHLQTGGVEEIGRGPGEGRNLNLPLPMGAGDMAYAAVLETCARPLLERFQPEMLIVASGVDANQFDPNGRQSVTMAGFCRLAGMVRELAGRLCEGRVLVVQEGGYNAAYGAWCAHGVMAGLLGVALGLDDPLAFYPEDPAIAGRIVDDLIDRHPLLE